VDALVVAMLAAIVFFVLEGRGLTLLVDDWDFGFVSRTNFDASAFLSDHNGHLVAIPIALTKASLQVFGADAALPLRLTTLVVHLTAVTCLFFLLRAAIGTAAAVPPTVLVLFLGAANDVLIGSHGLPFTISVATGLAAWLALRQGRASGDLDRRPAARPTLSRWPRSPGSSRLRGVARPGSTSRPGRPLARIGARPRCADRVEALRRRLRGAGRSCGRWPGGDPAPSPSRQRLARLARPADRQPASLDLRHLASAAGSES
jgi:hypothetical protein